MPSHQPRPRRPQQHRIAIATPVVVLALAACGQASTPRRLGTAAQRPRPHRSAVIGRTRCARPAADRSRPLTTRVPALGTPVSASWQTGILGSTGAPGPSSFWIDAAARVTPELVTVLRSTGSLSATSAPTVCPAVRSALPGGPWLAGPDLDQALPTGGVGASAFLAPGSARVVLVVVGGN